MEKVLKISFCCSLCADKSRPTHSLDNKNQNLQLKKDKDVPNNGSGHIAAQTISFRELAAATQNFRADCLVGEGGFGRVYKGRLDSIRQVNFVSSRS